MSINSKRKGSKFELAVSKWLTLWSGYKFQRTPYSGANHFNRELASDIMCADPKHQFRCKISVECKSSDKTANFTGAITLNPLAEVGTEITLTKQP